MANHEDYEYAYLRRLMSVKVDLRGPTKPKPVSDSGVKIENDPRTWCPEFPCIETLRKTEGEEA